MTLKTVKLQSFRGFPPPGPPPGLCPGPAGRLSAPPKPAAENVAPSARIAPPKTKTLPTGLDGESRRLSTEEKFSEAFVGDCF